MTRSSAREIAMHIIFSLGFDDRSAQEVLDAELNRERFQELAEELPLYIGRKLLLQSMTQLPEKSWQRLILASGISK